ncbi:MAG: enoyl-CoA hydratase-related protein [Bdellovibrionota bacterium]
MSEIVISEINNVAYVKLHRPDVRNAFNPEMVKELKENFLAFEKRKDLRAIVLLGEGKIFCAGADLQWMQSMINFNFEQNKQDAANLFEMFEAILNCSIPVIGQVHGAAFGGALGLIAVCDEVVAEESTQFCFSEVKLGLIPAVISGFISLKASLFHVRPLMFSGRVFDITMAMNANLVHHRVPNGEAHREVQKLLHKYIDGGPEAIRETKKLMNSIYWSTWDEQKEKTCKLIAERRVSREGQDGLRSFLDGKKPEWKS